MGVRAATRGRPSEGPVQEAHRPLRQSRKWSLRPRREQERRARSEEQNGQPLLSRLSPADSEGLESRVTNHWRHEEYDLHILLCLSSSLPLSCSGAHFFHFFRPLQGKACWRWETAQRRPPRPNLGLRPPPQALSSLRGPCPNPFREQLSPGCLPVWDLPESR